MIKIPSIIFIIIFSASANYSQGNYSTPIYWHVEFSSGTVAGSNINPNPYIPMLRVGLFVPLDPRQEEMYLGGHVSTFWRNPGFGLQVDLSFHLHIKTFVQVVSCYVFPEAGYSYVSNPSDGGSIFVGGGLALSSSYLIITFRASYLIRLNNTMIQVGAGVKL